MRKELETGTIMFQEVDEFGYDFTIKNTTEGKPNQLHYYVPEIFQSTNQRLIVLEKGNWKLLGDSKQLTEDDLSLIGLNPEAFNSLKESLGIVDVNKYGEKPVFAYEFGEDGPTDAMLHSAQYDFDYKSIQWQQEQSKVRKHIVLFEAKK